GSSDPSYQGLRGRAEGSAQEERGLLPE
ncbi:hypothetical protein A2U01_0117733, partial [Trifolium medium]|nr:hypothetical protein [Trifolium medium]